MRLHKVNHKVNHKWASSVCKVRFKDSGKAERAVKRDRGGGKVRGARCEVVKCEVSMRGAG